MVEASFLKKVNSRLIIVKELNLLIVLYEYIEYSLLSLLI